MALSKVKQKSVRGGKTGRPVMVAFELLGRRGALRVLWELRGEPLTFRALLQAADSNPGALNTRLAELRAAGLVGHSAAGYALSDEGQRCLGALEPLAEWAQVWGRRSVDSSR